MPESLVLACVLAVAGYAATLATMRFAFRFVVIDLSPDDPSLLHGVDLELPISAAPPPLPATVVIARVLVLGLLLALAIGLAARAVSAMRRREPGAAARLAPWAGVLALLLGLAGAAHGISALARDHPHSALLFGRRADLIEVQCLATLGGLVFLIALAGRTWRRGGSGRSVLPLLSVAVLTAGILLCAWMAFEFWESYRWIHLGGEQRPGAVSAGARFLAVGAVVAAVLVTAAALRCGGRGRRPGWARLPLRLAATALVALVFLGSLPLWSATAVATRSKELPESFGARLEFLAGNAGRSSIAFAIAAAALVLLAAWSWIHRWRSAVAGPAAAWVGAVVVGVAVYGVAEALGTLMGTIERLGATIIPADLRGIPQALSVALIGLPVFLAARTLAFASPSARKVPAWAERSRRVAIVLLAAGAISLIAEDFLFPGSDWATVAARWGSAAFLGCLAVIALASVVGSIRRWLVSCRHRDPSRWRRRALRRAALRGESCR